MLDDLEAARDQYARAQAAVIAAQQALAHARAEVPRAREHLAAEIVKATRAGHRQIDIAQASGYRREQVRRIQRAAGVEPPGDA